MFSPPQVILVGSKYGTTTVKRGKASQSLQSKPPFTHYQSILPVGSFYPGIPTGERHRNVISASV